MDNEAVYSEMDKKVEVYAKKQIAKKVEKVEKINTSSISSVKQTLI